MSKTLKCQRPPRGWVCKRGYWNHSGPCAAVPSWWNLIARFMHRKTDW